MSCLEIDRLHTLQRISRRYTLQRTFDGHLGDMWISREPYPTYEDQNQDTQSTRNRL